jgi:flagellar biosynthesis protein FlhA
VAGATVIDRSSVITTHLGEVASRHAGQLLSAQQVKTLLDSVKQTDPAVIEEMGAAQVTLTDLHRVLCGLLDEGVGIRNLVRVIEAVTEQARQAKDPESMLESARRALGPAITAMYMKDGTLPIMSLEPRFERQLADAVRPGDGGTILAIEPDVVDALVREVGAIVRQAEEHSRDPVLICASRLRPSLRRLLSPALPRLGVLSVNELGPQVKIERIGVVSVSPAQVV